MQFGQVPSLGKITLSLPPDTARTEKFLHLPRTGQTQVLVGAPIWASRNWVGTLYPKGAKTAELLQHYSRQFKTVEVNSTFYQLLDQDRIRAWRDQTPSNFRFCPKVFRGITERLTSQEWPSLVRQFCDSISAFEGRLGLTFAQFSDAFGPSQALLLERFVKAWPKEIPLAIELRHRAWFRDHALLDEVVNLFYRHQVATVITDTCGRRDALHLSLTQPKVLVRFQGNDGHPSDEARIKQWQERLAKWRSCSLQEVYFIVHQPDDAHIPASAMLARKWITPEVQTEPLAMLPSQPEMF